MRLFIAEKPDLAKCIVSGMDGHTTKHDGYIKVGNDIVTWCFGHLLELKKPENIDPNLKKWSLETLPLPPVFEMMITEKSKKQFNIIQGLLKNIDERNIVNAGDADDEGQLLVDEILTFCGKDPCKAKRIILSDMNAGAAKKAIEKLKDNKEYIGLGYRALARQRADFYYGLNLTRAFTLKGQESGHVGVLSIGRVQSAILGLIVNRYKANKNFKESYFYKVIANIKYDDRIIKCELIPPEDAPVDDKGRIIDSAYADNLISQLKGKSLTVTDNEKSLVKKNAPLPFSLLKLQVHLEGLGVNADETLSITQKLREKFKCISYNRSDCRYISTEEWERREDTFKTLNSSSLTFNYDKADLSLKSKAVNDKKISAHTAIVPVPTNSDLSEMSKKELLVYNEICRYYVAQYYPEKIIEKNKLSLNQDNYKFFSTNSIVISKGWEEIVADNESDENLEFDSNINFESIKKGDSFNIEETTILNGKTTAPALYTRASLLDDLPLVAKYIVDSEIKKLLIEQDKEKDAADKKGIGTPATRASIIKTLEERDFFKLVKKSIVPTDKGLQFFESLPSIITSPDITALWGEQFDNIQNGNETVSSFLDKTIDWVASLVNETKETSLSITSTHVCPDCGKGLVRRKGKESFFWGCSGYPVCKKTLPDSRGKPSFTVKKEQEKTFLCPNCNRKLKRLKSKKDENAFYWACEGVFDKEKQCKTFLNDKKGTPEIKK